MAKLADLTAAQLKSLKDYDPQQRAAVIELYRAARVCKAALQQYAATIVPILSILDGTEDLPTDTALSGAVPFGQPDSGFIVSDFQALVNAVNTITSDAGHVVLHVKAAGEINLVGQ